MLLMKLEPYVVYCDVLRNAMGNKFFQFEEDGDDHFILFTSRQLIVIENNYMINEQKGLCNHLLVEKVSSLFVKVKSQGYD
jgi:hypothetical protein